MAFLCFIIVQQIIENVPNIIALIILTSITHLLNVLFHLSCEMALSVYEICVNFDRQVNHFITTASCYYLQIKSKTGFEIRYKPTVHYVTEFRNHVFFPRSFQLMIYL